MKIVFFVDNVTICNQTALWWLHDCCKVSKCCCFVFTASLSTCKHQMTLIKFEFIGYITINIAKIDAWKSSMKQPMACPSSNKIQISIEQNISRQSCLHQIDKRKMIFCSWKGILFLQSLCRFLIEIFMSVNFLSEDSKILLSACSTKH